MKVKEILNLNIEDFEKMMSEEEFERMQNLGMAYAWELLDALKDSARYIRQDEEEEYITISAYLDYLEDMKE